MLTWLSSLMPDSEAWLGLLALIVAAGLVGVWSRLLRDLDPPAKEIPPMSADWRASKERHRER